MIENLKEFIQTLGALCETWIIIYRNFLNQGLSKDEALLHTKAFMEVLFNNNENDGGTNEDN